MYTFGAVVIVVLLHVLVCGNSISYVRNNPQWCKTIAESMASTKVPFWGKLVYFVKTKVLVALSAALMSLYASSTL